MSARAFIRGLAHEMIASLSKNPDIPFLLYCYYTTTKISLQTSHLGHECTVYSQRPFSWNLKKVLT